MSAFILKHDVVFLSNAAEPIATPQAIQNTTEENAAAIEKKIKANLQNYKTYATSEDIEKRLKTLVDQYTQQEKEKWIKEVNGDQSSQIPSDNKKIWREDGQRKAMKSIGNEILAIETSINENINNYVNGGGDYRKICELVTDQDEWNRLCYYFGYSKLSILKAGDFDKKPYANVTADKTPNLYKIFVEAAKNNFTNKIDKLASINRSLLSTDNKENIDRNQIATQKPPPH